MNLKDLTGHVFPPRTFVAEEQLSIANYARAVGSEDPALRSSRAARETGFSARPVPPTLLTFVLTMDERDFVERIGIDYGRTLFGGVEFEFGATATEDEELIGQSRVAEAYQREGRDGVERQFLVLETSFTNRSGALVSRSRVTFIERAES